MATNKQFLGKSSQLSGAPAPPFNGSEEMHLPVYSVARGDHGSGVPVFLEVPTRWGLHQSFTLIVPADTQGCGERGGDTQSEVQGQADVASEYSKEQRWRKVVFGFILPPDQIELVWNKYFLLCLAPI